MNKKTHPSARVEIINMEDQWKNYRENNFLRSSILVASTSRSLKLLHDCFHRCSCCGLRGAVSSSLISFLIGTIEPLVAQTDSSYARNSKRTGTDQRVTSLANPNYHRLKLLFLDRFSSTKRSAIQAASSNWYYNSVASKVREKW